MTKCKDFIVDALSLPESARGIDERMNRDDLHMAIGSYGFERVEGEIDKHDLIIFRLPGEWHVGMFLGRGMFKHWLSKKGYMNTRLDNRFWRERIESIWRKQIGNVR